MAARPFERVAQTVRGDGIDDMRFNGEQLLLSNYAAISRRLMSAT